MLEASVATTWQASFAESMPNWVNAFATICAAIWAYLAWLDWKRQELARRRSLIAEEILFDAELAAATLQQFLGSSSRVENCAAIENLDSTPMRMAAIRASNLLSGDLIKIVARLKASNVRARSHFGADVSDTISNLVRRFERVQDGAVLLSGLKSAGGDSSVGAAVLSTLEPGHLNGFGLDVTKADGSHVVGRSARDVGDEVRGDLQRLTSLLEEVIRSDDLGDPARRTHN